MKIGRMMSSIGVIAAFMIAAAVPLAGTATGAVALSAGATAPGSTSSRSPAPPFSVDAGNLNVTNQDVWAHGCAAAHCGYHLVPSGKHVLALCSTDNEGLQWNLITAVAWWNPNIIIAGFADRRALDGPGAGGQQCENVGIGTWVNTETWEHSCPSASCGWGATFAGHDIATICWTPLSDDGFIWDLVLDHDSEHKDLAGFVREVDIPGPKASVRC